MSFKCTYIGDPLPAVAFTLLGAERLSPERTPAAVSDALRAARSKSDLVLIQNEYAALIDARLQAIAIAEPIPPIAVIPSLAGEIQLADDGVRKARVVLGISS